MKDVLFSSPKEDSGLYLKMNLKPRGKVVASYFEITVSQMPKNMFDGMHEDEWCILSSVLVYGNDELMKLTTNPVHVHAFVPFWRVLDTLREGNKYKYVSLMEHIKYLVTPYCDTVNPSNELHVHADWDWRVSIEHNESVQNIKDAIIIETETRPAETIVADF